MNRPAVFPAPASRRPRLPIGPRPEPPGLNFSPREMQTLYLVACGRTRKQIAAMLEISLCTVDVYRRQVFDKLGARNAVDLQRHVMLSGWLSLDLRRDSWK
ncbi:MAG: LuxR C-terminal-related transcriptional regulator [Solimonas sp.]